MRQYFSTLSLVFCLSVSLNLSAEEPDMDTFFADPKNQHAFQKALREDKFEIIRNNAVDACLASVESFDKMTDAIRKECDCIANELEKITDKALFYERALANQRDNALYQAEQKNDIERLKKLRKEHAQKPLFSGLINQTCKAN